MASPPLLAEPQSPPPPKSSTQEEEEETKKSQPIPWTYQETTNLIQAYQEKWYSLKRGQLKSSQWEEVAITVAARCSYDHPSKSATQCRHKIEKLRKRYRSELLKPLPNNNWPFFHLMHQLEQGPLPISSAPPVHHKKILISCSTDSDDDDNVVGFSNANPNPSFDRNKNKSKSINHIIRGVDGSDRVLRKDSNFKKRKDFSEDEDVEEEHKEGEALVELAGEMRAFAERFVRMENKKIEMMRDSERYRMEMENKRMEMILGSQRKLVDTIHLAFSSSRKKMKTAQ